MAPGHHFVPLLVVQCLISVIRSEIVLRSTQDNDRSSIDIRSRILENEEIFNYPDSFGIKPLELAMGSVDNGPVKLSNMEEVDAFQFRDILGSTQAEDEKICAHSCRWVKNCVAVNYVRSIKFCVYLSSFRPDGAWEDSAFKMLPVYPEEFPDNPDAPVGQKHGPCPEKPGQPFFAPALGLEATGRRSRRVLNGRDAAPFSFPWIVRLNIVDLGGSDEQDCAGTLITEEPASGRYVGESTRFVLTAAHCLVNLKKSEDTFLTVTVGSYDDAFAEKNEFQLEIETYTVHSEFSTETHQFDVALIKLKEPAFYNEFVRPIALASSYLPPENQKCFVAGWGGAHERAKYETSRLQQASIQYMKDDDCAIHEEFDRKSMNCYTFHTENARVESGDSGGPVFCADVAEPKPQFLLYGVVSATLVVSDDGKISYSCEIGTAFAKLSSWVAEKVEALGGRGAVQKTDSKTLKRIWKIFVATALTLATGFFLFI